MSTSFTLNAGLQNETFYDYSDSEYCEIMEAEQIAAEYRQWELQQAADLAPVVAMYTNTLPATPAAISPIVGQLVQANDAIAAAISELNMQVLNTADSTIRTQVKQIAILLIKKAPLMDVTKDNYLQMLEAAEVNAAFYFKSKDVEPKEYVSVYKRKYDSATDIAKHLATTSTRKEIASLYYVNAELIEQTKELKDAFTARKAKFYPAIKAVA